MTFFGSSSAFRLNVILLFAIYCANRPTLDNGLAQTPPMGWLSWARFTCNIDCDKYPDECINEKLYMDMADRLAADGWKELGYEYVNIDDCWSEKERDPTTGRLIPDKLRFPNGIKGLADYVHAKGLKLGLYNDMGDLTCGGYPGLWTGNLSLFDIDAQTFAEWEIDHLKVDGCNINNTADFDWLFPKFGQALNKTGRPILYSCEWPLYQYNQGINPNYTAITNVCNLVRNYNDIQDSWDSVTKTLAFFAKNQDEFVSQQSGYGLSADQSEAQFAIWAMLSTPLYMSNDLRRISDWQKAILQKNFVINVNQDPLGIMARLVTTKDNIDVYVKPMVDGQFAVSYLNRNQLGSGVFVSHPLSDLIPADKLKRFR